MIRETERQRENYIRVEILDVLNCAIMPLSTQEMFRTLLSPTRHCHSFIIDSLCHLVLSDISSA